MVYIYIYAIVLLVCCVYLCMHACPLRKRKRNARALSYIAHILIHTRKTTLPRIMCREMHAAQRRAFRVIRA